jgi:hypothetical protein
MSKPKVGPSGTNTGNAGKGRQKGSVNKTTKEAKEAIELAFSGLGGVDALIAWAKGNQDAFYGSVWPKLLPVQHKHGGDQENPIALQMIERRIVNADN